MSKESSKKHTEEMKDKYLRNCRSVTVKNVLLIGHAEGNIADSILKALEPHHNVVALDIDDFNINDYDQRFNMLANYTNYDTIIFNNAIMGLDWIGEISHSYIQDCVDTILTSTMKVTDDFVRNTLDKPVVKTVIYIGSMAYNHVLNASSAYCAAKAGLAMYAKCAAYELAPKGYRVFTIHPSNVADAPMSEQTVQELVKLRGLCYEDAVSYWAAECPMGTFLQKDEIASLVKMLLTDEARYLSGSNLELAGGQR
jgi:NAD(P)-dependent dehydrogenase (short-subunit alcohol dehydrogenase family)